MRKTKATKIALIKEALKNPPVDSAGQLNIKRVVLDLDLADNDSSRKLVREIAAGMGLKLVAKRITNGFIRYQSAQGMQIGPKSIHLKWEDFKLPAVYAIVCKGNGKMFIGSSVRPDLRRNVHYFYLRNTESGNNGNIFLTNEEIKRDIEKYGPDSFYMEIIQFFPKGTSRAERQAIGASIMSKLPFDATYNFYKKGYTRSHKRETRQNPEYKKAAVCLIRRQRLVAQEPTAKNIQKLEDAVQRLQGIERLIPY